MLGENLRAIVMEPEGGRIEGEGEQPVYDFSSCQRLKKLTTHDIYRFTHEGRPLIVKLFAPQALSNYQQELACLRCVANPALLRILHHHTAADPASPDPLLRSHLIVMAEATRGDLNDYLPKYGRMGEKMSRTLFRKLVEALQDLSELHPPLLHPNLVASNVLLTEEAEVRLCGWSEVSPASIEQRQRENVFSCGEILVCMLTSFMPFYKKYSPTDTYFKFLSSEHIHKFWQELHKKMQRMDKKFTFSPEVRDLIQGIFLRKLTKFSQVVAHHWTRGEVYEKEELLRLLEENEKSKNEKLSARRKQEAANEEKKKKALHQYQLSFGVQRSPSEENQEFLKDCEENVIREQELPVSHSLGSLKVSASPNFVIASLKDLLRSQKGKSSVVLCEQFQLSHHKVVRVSNYVKVELAFSVGELQEEQQDLLQGTQQDTVSLSLKIAFCRQGKDVCADVEVLESNFNAYYTNLALAFIEDRIRRRKETTQ